MRVQEIERAIAQLPPGELIELEPIQIEKEKPRLGRARQSEEVGSSTFFALTSALQTGKRTPYSDRFLMQWLENHHHEKWDEQIEADLVVGHLDSLINQAEYQAGKAHAL